MDPIYHAKSIIVELENNPFVTEQDKKAIKYFKDLLSVTKNDAYIILNIQKKLNRKKYKLARELRKVTK